ncbi:hypothetical protein ACFL0V_04405 [Nanoarchaeota archaeon]
MALPNFQGDFTLSRLEEAFSRAKSGQDIMALGRVIIALSPIVYQDGETYVKALPPKPVRESRVDGTTVTEMVHQYIVHVPIRGMVRRHPVMSHSFTVEGRVVQPPNFALSTSLNDSLSEVGVDPRNLCDYLHDHARSSYD